MRSLSDFVIVPEDAETESSCACCGRPVLHGVGNIQWRGNRVAAYWYMWPEGHERRFELAVRWGAAGAERIVAASGGVTADDIQFSIIAPAECPWPKLNALGRLLDREAALADADYPDFWELFDAVAYLEPALAPRLRAPN